MGLSRFRTACALVLGGLTFLGVSGCNNPLISGVDFNVEPNLETVKVQLNFDSSLQSDLGGTFDVANGNIDYGQVEVEPSTPDNPFNVGFRLNLEIVNDQDYVKYTPVQDLPSGQPIPIPNLNRAMAKIQLKNQINPNFDVYAYADIAGKQWVGLALVLKFVNQKYFPAGLAVSQGFVKGKDGNNRIYGAVFGPKVDNNGNMLVPGGIALFANAAGLIADAKAGAPLAGHAKGTNMVLFQGPRADFYNSHPHEAMAVGEAFKELLRANSFGNHMM